MTHTRSPLQERLTNIMRRFPQGRVAVIGDLIADQFLYGEISRVSREAPVLILRHERTETMPGGAANCAMNLAALGAQTRLVGVAGEDGAGRAMLSKLRAAGVDCGGVVTTTALRTTTKIRVLAGQAHSTRQQVIRVDFESDEPLDASVRERLNVHLRDAANDADAIIISDYNYGVADADTAGALRDLAARRGAPVIVDSRFRLAQFPGFTSATPNEAEVEQLLGRRLPDAAALEAAGAELLGRLSYNSLLITRGGKGMMLFETGVPKPLHIAAVGSSEPVDVTGAGDTVIATFALALGSGASAADAAHLANHAGGLVVMKRGTASVNRQELLASVLHGNAA